MEAKDLRKGNIVKNDKLDFFKKGYIILEARDIYNLAVFESGQTVDEQYKCFDPIKLTVQWLYEFGFKSDTDETDEFILNGFRIYKISENLEFANHDFPIKLEFVHQLQNLFFALTGSELVFSA